MLDAYRDEAPGETQGHAAPEKKERKPRTPHKPRPAIGRIIHVRATSGLIARLAATPDSHLAAIITAVYENGRLFNAIVFSPVGNQPVNGYPLNLADEDDTWHWPERD